MPLRAAVVGLGWAGTVHARALANLDDVELVAAADPDPARRAELPGLPVVTTLDEVLARRPDYCVVAVPTSHHEAVGLRLAQAGVHALIEKPLAADLAAATRLVSAFADAGLVAAVGHSERRNPAVADLQRRLANGEFGEIYQIETRRHGPFPDRVRDVGVVRDLAIHDVDLAAWLAGERIESVTAQVHHVGGRVHEDFASVLCRMSGGRHSSHQLSRMSPHRERVVVAHTAAGRVSADALTCTLVHHPHGAAPDARPAARHLPMIRPPFTLQNEAFRDTLLGRRSDLVPLVDGAAAVAVTDAILRAAHTAAAVAVPDVTSPAPTTRHL